MPELFKSYTFEDYTVRKATPYDSDTVIRILRDAAKWLIGKGIHQWDYYLTDEAAAEINEAVETGTTYLVVDQDNCAVATFNLSAEQSELDTSVWGDRNDKALYLHRLAIDKTIATSKSGKSSWNGFLLIVS